MEPISVADVVKLCKGELVTGSSCQTISGISLDSRTVRQGELFIPIQGKRFDGHDFIPQALERGTAAVLVGKERVREVLNWLRGNVVVIRVDDTLVAFHNLARGYRRRFQLPVVAVTGSTGKTTTKDMVASILAQWGPVLKSQGNFNNEIGLPLTLLQLNRKHRALVVEMGMRGPGQIRTLTEMAWPDVGIVTNVGTAHMELLGSRTAIQAAKRELVETMAAGTTVVLNADDPRVREMAGAAANKKVLYFGMGAASSPLPFGTETVTLDVSASHIVSLGEQGIRFQLHHGGEAVVVDLPVPGRHNVSNALAAAAAALALGMELKQIRAGLVDFQLSGMRMEVLQLPGDGVIINDAYNANPTSMAAAITTAAELAAGRPLVLVLGDMLELGATARQAHMNIGRQVAEAQPVHLITVGSLARYIGAGAREAGLPGKKITSCKDYQEAAGLLSMMPLPPNKVVLVKGSRAVALEHVVEELVNHG